MGSGIYRTLAKSNIVKNKRFFIPRMLTESGLLACLYIMFTLATDDDLRNTFGGTYLSVIMGLGTIIVLILSTIIMMYVNSFLMKQRKPEFGLYHCLGMEKRHVGHVLFYESLIAGSISVLSGTVFGILFYKVCSLIVCKLLHQEVILGFSYIRPKSVILPVLLFLLIDVITFIANRISIARMRPVDLININHKGEKEPRIRWVLLIIGIIALGAGYAISLCIENPIQAISYFFIAVLLVILGTYFLFTAGSVFILSILRKNERFYYKKLNMPSVSGLLFRMKQNAVGLASITILVTCVLVMLSTTISLYTGMEQTLTQFYHNELYIRSEFNGQKILEEDKVTDALTETSGATGFEITDITSIRYVDITALKSGNAFEFRRVDTMISDLDDLSSISLMSKTSYEVCNGTGTGPKEGEVFVFPISDPSEEIPDTIVLNGIECKVGKTDDIYPVQDSMSNIVSVYGVVADDELVDRLFRAQKELFKDHCSEYTTRIAVKFKDRDAFIDRGSEFMDILNGKIEPMLADSGYHINSVTDDIAFAKKEIYGLYGTFLFLGCLLGIVFILTTALIIYYKQISEGYEDRSRFKIMEKIGMSRKEVRHTIRTQILMIFFLPLIVAGIHVAFAYPLLYGLLRILLMPNAVHFILCALIIYLVFAVVYALIYSATSKIYYNIVK